MNKMLKTYQDWCIDTLCNILSNKNSYRGVFEDQGYIYAIKAIIDHYSSMYYCTKKFCRKGNKEHINLWWDHLNKENQSFAFSPLFMSEKAYDIVEQSKNNNDDPKKLKEKLHFEHITPKGYTFNKIKRLSNINPKTVKECFKYAKLILITKDESKLLDGSGVRYSTDDLEHFKNNLGKGKEEDISEAKKILNQTLNDKGSGLIRIDYLIKNKVVIVDSNGTKKNNTEILNYLQDDDFVIQ